MAAYKSDGYLGNSHLKGAGSTTEWTPEMIKEYVKCSEDPVYFAKTYIKIVHVDHGLIPFEMYDYQEEITEKIFSSRRVAVLTARQAGKCVCINTIVKVKNKNTGEIKEMTIGDLYDNQKKKTKSEDDADQKKDLY
jgi:hypothetical protein